MPRTVSDRPEELRCSQCDHPLSRPAAPAATAAALRALDAGDPAEGTAQPQPNQSWHTADAPEASATKRAAPAEQVAFAAPGIERLAPEADWELEWHIDGVRHLVARLAECMGAEGTSAAPTEDGCSPAAPRGSSPLLAAGRSARAHPEPGRSYQAPFSWLAYLAWSGVGLGLTCLSCGSVLLVWSVVAGRDDLWSLGLALAVLGQGGLFWGLITQLTHPSAPTQTEEGR